MAAQSTAEASKKEACFHVELQRIAEGTIPYQPTSLDRTKRSAGTVTCAPKGAVTPRGSRPLFY